MKLVAYLKGPEAKQRFRDGLLLLLVAYLFLSGSWQHLYWILIPRQPVLLEMDWNDSSMKAMREYPSQYEKGVSYFVHLVCDSYEDHPTRIMQITTWYANIEIAKDAWEDPQKQIDIEIRFANLPILYFSEGLIFH